MSVENSEICQSLILRGPDGCFLGADESNLEADRNLSTQRATNRRNRAISTDLFEKLLDVMFLVGSAGEWIPAASGVGPIHAVATRLLRKRYLLPARKQAELMRMRYFNGDVTRKVQSLPRIRAWPLDIPDPRPQIVRAYINRRLPKLETRSLENAAVREWLNEAQRLNALHAESLDSAFAAVLSIVADQATVNGKTRYRGYPVSRNGRNVELGETNSREVRNGGSNETNHQSNLSSQRNEAGSSEDAEARLASFRPRAHVENVESRSTATPRISRGRITLSSAHHSIPRQEENEEDLRRKMYVGAVVEAAKNDKMFRFMCMFDEESSECKIDLVSGILLNHTEIEKIGAYPIMLDCLRYGNEKHYGARNIQEHLERRDRIRGYVEDIKAVRRWLGLRPFEDMRWGVGVTREAERQHLNHSPSRAIETLEVRNGNASSPRTSPATETVERLGQGNATNRGVGSSDVDTVPRSEAPLQQERENQRILPARRAVSGDEVEESRSVVPIISPREQHERTDVPPSLSRGASIVGHYEQPDQLQHLCAPERENNVQATGRLEHAVGGRTEEEEYNRRVSTVCTPRIGDQGNFPVSGRPGGPLPTVQPRWPTAEEFQPQNMFPTNSLHQHVSVCGSLGISSVLPESHRTIPEANRSRGVLQSLNSLSGSCPEQRNNSQLVPYPERNMPPENNVRSDESPAYVFARQDFSPTHNTDGSNEVAMLRYLWP